MAFIDGNLTGILHKAGKLNDEQARVLRERAAHSSDKELGLLLINAGYVSQTDILLSIRAHVLDIVYRLITWAEGLDPAGRPVVIPGTEPSEEGTLVWPSQAAQSGLSSRATASS